MNWTLVSAIYGDYFHGNEAKGIFSNLAAETHIKIACSKILPLSFTSEHDYASKSLIDGIANCIKSFHTRAHVVVLFTSTSATTTILKRFWESEALRDLTFVFANTNALSILTTYPFPFMTSFFTYLIGMLCR